jgi:YHS domain-containing protein
MTVAKASAKHTLEHDGSRYYFCSRSCHDKFAAKPSAFQGLRLIEHGEMRRDLRFQREALQQPLAEAVDGVDLEAAFGLQRLGEETPRRLHFRTISRTPK